MIIIAQWWRSYPREDSGTDKVEVRSAIDLIDTMDFGQHMEVASLDAIEEMMAVASFLQAP